MKAFIHIVLFSIALSLAGCKKKDPVITKVPVDEETPDFVYGRIMAWSHDFINEDSMHDFKGSLQLSFVKAPGNNLSSYPNLSSFTGSPGNFSYDREFGSLSATLYGTQSSPNPIADFNFSFESPELGHFNFAEKDTTMPYCDWSVKDTLYISKNSITTFTLFISPKSFQGKFVLGETALNFQVVKSLLPGLNIVKIYPDDIRLMGPNYFPESTLSFDVVFTQERTVYVDKKRYFYQRETSSGYPAKITN